MLSRTCSVAKELRRLRSLLPGMAGSGLPSRPRLAALALRPPGRRSNPVIPNSLVLLDANDNKVVHAEREFLESCTRLDPLEVPLRFTSRLFLIGSIMLTGRIHVAASVFVLASNLRRQFPEETRWAVYNPYHLLHYAIADLVPIEKVFHLAPEYPRLDGARQAIACSAAHEILGYRPEQQRLTLQPHTIVEDRPVVRVYLTQILGLVKLREEAALVEFARWVKGRSDVSVEIFLHYQDRDIDESDPRARSLFEDFGVSVRRDASLHSLSSRQVSFSGSSSIGYDLLSSDICHVMVVDPDRHAAPKDGEAGRRLARWRAERADVINFDTYPVGWLEALHHVDEDRFKAVFGCPPGEV